MRPDGGFLEAGDWIPAAPHLVAFGILLTLGAERLLRAWTSHATRSSELWSGAFCLTGSAICAARFVELASEAPDAHWLASRAQLALSFLLGLVCLFTVETWLERRSIRARVLLVLLGGLAVGVGLWAGPVNTGIENVQSPLADRGALAAALLLGTWVLALGSYLLAVLSTAERPPWSLRPMVLTTGGIFFLAAINDVALTTGILDTVPLREAALVVCGITVSALSEQRSRWQVSQERDAAVAQAKSEFVEAQQLALTSIAELDSELCDATMPDSSPASSSPGSYPQATQLARAATRLASIRRRLTNLSASERSAIEDAEQACLAAVRILGRESAPRSPRTQTPQAPPGEVPTEAVGCALAESGISARESGPVSRKISVLVIDDEPAIGSLVRRALANHQVTVSTSGRDAIARLTHERFELVLCDLSLEDTTGMNVFETVVRQAPELRRVFVFMTGGAYTPEAQEFLDTVGVPVLEKPMSLKSLRDLANARASEAA